MSRLAILALAVIAISAFANPCNQALQNLVSRTKDLQNSAISRRSDIIIQQNYARASRTIREIFSNCARPSKTCEKHIENYNRQLERIRASVRTKQHSVMQSAAYGIDAIARNVENSCRVQFNITCKNGLDNAYNYSTQIVQGIQNDSWSSVNFSIYHAQNLLPQLISVCSNYGSPCQWSINASYGNLSAVVYYISNNEPVHALHAAKAFSRQLRRAIDSDCKGQNNTCNSTLAGLRNQSHALLNQINNDQWYQANVTAKNAQPLLNSTILDCWSNGPYCVNTLTNSTFDLSQVTRYIANNEPSHARNAARSFQGKIDQASRNCQ